MQTLSFADLAPVLAAVLGPILLLAVTIMRYQHVDSTKTRDLIDRNREASEQAHKETRDLIDRNREASEQAHKETRDLIDKNYREMVSGLGRADARLSRIEGTLGILSATAHNVDDSGTEAA